MKLRSSHPWDLSPKEAIELQKKLAIQVLQRFDGREIGLVAGTDLSYDRASNKLFAAVVVLTFPGLEMIEIRSFIENAEFPYIPGLLSFREIPSLFRCFENLNNIPDIILCDGQGIAHPRRFGLASHLGVLTGIPSIGCAKSRLTGSSLEPGIEKGCREVLADNGDVIGYVLRSKRNVKPLYISPGHLMDINTAVDVTLKCCIKYRLPEPTRLAHLEVNRIRKSFL